jgi:hypothetical protein
MGKEHIINKRKVNVKERIMNKFNELYESIISEGNNNNLKKQLQKHLENYDHTLSHVAIGKAEKILGHDKDLGEYKTLLDKYNDKYIALERRYRKAYLDDKTEFKKIESEIENIHKEFLQKAKPLLNKVISKL